MNLVFHLGQRLCSTAGDRFFERIQQARPVAEAQHVTHRRASDFFAIHGLHDGLIENREAVANGTFGSPGDQSESLFRDFRPFMRGDPTEMFRQIHGIEPFQVKPLAARQYRDRHFADLSSCEDELHMRGRLFQRFQQRVERGRRQHVNLIDDVDLVPRRDRCVACPVQQVAHVGNAGAAGGVKFQHVRMTARHNGIAMLALRVEPDRRAVMIV